MMVLSWLVVLIFFVWSEGGKIALTLQDASKMFGIPVDTLQQYEKNGFLQGMVKDSKAGNYEEDDFKQLGLVHFLLNAGFTQKEVRKYLELIKNNETGEEQIRMLRKQRCELLDGIHEKQQMLDQIDYMIWEKKKGVVGNPL